MAEKIGIIERINNGHGVISPLGIKIWGARDDTLCIAKYYEPTWRNLFKIKQLGKFDIASSLNEFNERDLVKVTIENKRIVSVEKTGALTEKEMLLHDLRGSGAIAATIILVLLLIISLQSWGVL